MLVSPKNYRVKKLIFAFSLLAGVIYFLVNVKALYSFERYYSAKFLNLKLSEVDISFCDEFNQGLSTMKSNFEIKTQFNFNLDYVNKWDITLVTQLSCDRIDMMILLLKHWQGPISLALYCNEKDAPNFVQRILDYHYSQYISISVIYTRGKQQSAYYPINYLRNIALKNAMTEYVFLCDADFVPSFGLHKLLIEAARLFLFHSEINRALVVPAFEEKSKMLFFPQNKQELQKLYLNNTVSRFHDYFVGHLPTDYPKWFEESFPYRVNWKLDYEPYLVVRRSNVPFYNESFIGYGFNKLVHIAELQALKYEFIVLPQEFLIHKIHPKSSEYRLFANDEHIRKCLKFMYYDFLWKYLPSKHGNGWETFRRYTYTYKNIHFFI